MMSLLFLLDIRPGPAPIAGVGGLILLAVLVLIFTAALIVGFVFLLKALKRGSSTGAHPESYHSGFTRSMIGDVCLNFDNMSPQSNAVSHNDPSREKQHS